MAADGYAWWRRRITRQRDLFDLVRIDHFRGFEAAWHVPVEAPTAKDGWWVTGPGLDLLRRPRRRRRPGLARRRGPRRDHARRSSGCAASSGCPG